MPGHCLISQTPIECLLYVFVLEFLLHVDFIDFKNVQVCARFRFWVFSRSKTLVLEQGKKFKFCF